MLKLLSLVLCVGLSGHAFAAMEPNSIPNMDGVTEISTLAIYESTPITNNVLFRVIVKSSYTALADTYEYHYEITNQTNGLIILDLGPEAGPLASVLNVGVSANSTLSIVVNSQAAPIDVAKNLDIKTRKGYYLYTITKTRYSGKVSLMIPNSENAAFTVVKSEQVPN